LSGFFILVLLDCGVIDGIQKEGKFLSLPSLIFEILEPTPTLTPTPRLSLLTEALTLPEVEGVVVFDVLTILFSILRKASVFALCSAFAIWTKSDSSLFFCFSNSFNFLAFCVF
jgi:hypothetical protein